ncbi:MAG TPA: hypothetical protein VHW65_13100 [Gemmatimonadales bacterium]|jgi:hypothetical protein|nr:hypothetical protein [Gemmatimonadales bacterium]
MTPPEQNSLQQRLADLRVTAFAPGFADRVMRRMRIEPLPSLGAVLQRYFAILAPVAVAAILLIAVRNVRAANTTDSTIVAAALGLPPVTLASAYVFDAATDGAP